MTWVAFLVGTFVGFWIGFIVAALLSASRDDNPLPTLPTVGEVTEPVVVARRIAAEVPCAN